MAEVLQGRYHQSFDRFIDNFCAVGNPDRIREKLEQYWAAGVNDILFSPQVPWEGFEDQIERLSLSLEWRP